jgi:hypothetical protein
MWRLNNFSFSFPIISCIINNKSYKTCLLGLTRLTGTDANSKYMAARVHTMVILVVTSCCHISGHYVFSGHASTGLGVVRMQSGYTGWLHGMWSLRPKQKRGRGDSLIVTNRHRRLEILRKQPFLGLLWMGEWALLLQSGLTTFPSLIGPSIWHHDTHHNPNKIYEWVT